MILVVPNFSLRSKFCSSHMKIFHKVQYITTVSAREPVMAGNSRVCGFQASLHINTIRLEDFSEPTWS